MKLLYYTIKNYKYDLISVAVATILNLINFQYYEDPRNKLIVSVAIIFLSLTAIIYFRVRDKGFYYVSLRSRRDRDGWLGQGRFDYIKSEKCYEVTDAHPGYIFSKCLTWSDYRLSCDFKIINSCLGYLVKAINLSDYVLLQVGLVGIRPHVFVNGAWQVWEYKDTGLAYETPLSMDKWYKIVLCIENRNINIKILERRKKLFDRNWEIPKGALIFQFKKDEKDIEPASIPFQINLEYGSVGFRNAGRERGFVKEFLIEKI